jgi:hypothetical protein
MALKKQICLTIVLILAFFALVSSCGSAFGQKGKLPVFWPPKLDYYYPDLTLLDQNGKKVQLSSFMGKILVIEPIGMSCPACQAFCGANRKGLGPYGQVRPQSGLKSIDECLAQKGISTTDPAITFIQLLLYGPTLQAPTLAEAKAWARHFRVDSKSNYHVLVGNKSLINQASYNMIPGFQLVDKSFVLRSDATGHHPKNDLYSHLIPMLKRILSS